MAIARRNRNGSQRPRRTRTQKRASRSTPAPPFALPAVRKLEVVTGVPERAMVIFAHPDDAEIGSGGVVAKWVAAGCVVTYVLCTTGSAGTADRSLTSEQLARKRADEQRAAADFMGVPNLVMLASADGWLEDPRDFRGDVVRASRRCRPDPGITPDPDRSQ